MPAHRSRTARTQSFLGQSERYLCCVYISMYVGFFNYYIYVVIPIGVYCDFPPNAKIQEKKVL